MSQQSETTNVPLFTRRNLLVYPLAFVAVFILAWAAALGVQRLCELAAVPIDIESKWWPLSCFNLKVPGVHAPLLDLWRALGVLLVFLVSARRFSRPATANVCSVMLAGCLLVIGTNLIHGVQYGLVVPHLGDEKDLPDAARQYYQDAEEVTSAGQFLRGFEAGQAELGCHSRTHPPGAVLFHYWLLKIFGGDSSTTPVAVSVVIAVLSVGLSVFFLYRLLSHEIDRDTCGYVTLLFLCIPAIQIYYCATLDAVVASCCLGVLCFLRSPRALPSIAGMTGWLLCASFLTFGACFLLPVVVGFEIITQRSVRRSAAVLLGVSVLHTAIYLLSGFNYLTSLMTASALENPGGFLLLAEPVSYVMTRLENVADILLFFGPFMLAFLLRGTHTMLKGKTYRELLVLTGLGILTLLAMFLTGAFRTGETARACLFIYPYLTLPVAAYLHHRGCRQEDRRLLLWLVFGQSMAMQTLGGYYW